MRTLTNDTAISNDAQATPRKPRVMVAGEFSSGKTKLINGLLGETVLPSNVTATALPPIWLVSGDKGLLAVDLEGNQRPAASLQEVCVDDTSYCVLSHPAACLKQFEIIDTPGNSDPNIPAESWERMLAFADTVVWCSNATQAWRQSEKSVWTEMPDRLLNATMVITHADRMTDATSAHRVLRRVTREAGEFFDEIMMASLMLDADIARIAHHLKTICKGLPLSGGDRKIDFAVAQAITYSARSSSRLDGIDDLVKQPLEGGRVSASVTSKDLVATPLPAASMPDAAAIVKPIDAARRRVAAKMARSMS